MTTSHDPGLNAVARVRGAREQDSRIGLRQAVSEQQACEQRVADLRRRLDVVGSPADGDVAGFVLHHDLVRAFTQSVEAAQVDVEAANALAAAARAHWQADKTRLSAVEMLLERRAEERRTERRRREDRDLDEVVTQQWLRHRAGGAA